MQIFIRGAEETKTVEVNGTLSLSALKALVGGNMVVSHGGRILEGEGSLEEAGIANLATIDISNRLLGGKVHGSLARAGKVKGQTPKVDAQEKKKKKTGRAKRRIQYNRRFVNVVSLPGGRKKGPNSNQAP